jgi:tripartite-type tricarboxylate transporter receptor subunit TctC
MRTQWLMTAILGLLFVTGTVHAQQRYPTKPIRLIVPVAPGSGTDIMARMIATRLFEEFGQQFVVDNRGGAGGTIGAEIAAHANPDGYTVIVVGGSYAANAAIYKLSYDPVKGIAPISIIGTGPFALAVHPSVKATNLKEFIELARAKPGALTFGSSGVGSTLHFAGELFRQMTKTDMVHVPYKGGGPALADLLGGHIQVMFGPAVLLFPQIRAGNLRGIAVAGEQRAPTMPDLPAISELIPGYSVYAWYSMWAPAGTPREIVTRLNQALARILQQPDVVERLRAEGMQPAHSTPEEFSRVLAREIATWSKVVKAGNIKID